MLSAYFNYVFVVYRVGMLLFRRGGGMSVGGSTGAEKEEEGLVCVCVCLCV